MTRTVDLPLGNYQNGTRTTGWRAIPDTATFISVELARCTSADPTIWPNASTMVDLTIELSMDGGATVYLRATEGQIPGGIMPGKGGGEAPRSRKALWPIPPGSNRMVRLGASVSGGPIRTSGTIEIA
jgi:hypothetical protein